MSKAKLIVIEGQNCVGKETQTKLLEKRLIEEGFNVRRISFPDYDKPHSTLAKMYLNGEFGDNQDVDPKIASTFYAVDRYASYKTDWESFANTSGNIIIFDRYTTSNALFQSTKYQGVEKDNFLEWVFDLEYGLYNLPKPHIVFYLNIPTEKVFELIENRQNKITKEAKKDIHESDREYLINSSLNANYLIKKYNWREVECFKDNKLRSIQEINNELMEEIKKIIVQ